jgi:hypothetical protein
MIWFAIIAAVVLAAALIWWTITNTNRMPNPFAWKAAAAAILTLGLIPGFGIGFGRRYAWADTVQVQGFPIPLAFFVLEDGQWVDYIGFPPLGLLNVLYLDSIFLSPLSLVILCALRRRRATAVETPRTME